MRQLEADVITSKQSPEGIIEAMLKRLGKKN